MTRIGTEHGLSAILDTPFGMPRYGLVLHCRFLSFSVSYYICFILHRESTTVKDDGDTIDESGDDFRLYIHEHGTVPDMLNAMSVEVKIAPGFKTHIALSATMSETTEAFEEMSLEKRQCRLPQESQKFKAATLKNVCKLCSFQC